MKKLITVLVFISTFQCFSMDSSKIVLTKELLQYIPQTPRTPQMIYGHDHSPSMLKYQKPLSKKSQALQMLQSQSTADRKQVQEDTPLENRKLLHESLLLDSALIYSILSSYSSNAELPAEKGIAHIIDNKNNLCPIIIYNSSFQK